ncbi:hypothetical protein HEQ75_27695, partial [Roseomonas sp. BU-1]|nr:hypothetical protein [Falsiroseomonas selenitidurans]
MTQALGRPAEGIFALALHLGALRAGPASLLRARLLAGGRVLGAWTVPGDALAPGWLALDLPEPAPPGAAEAVLEVAAEAAPGETLLLSATGPEAGAPLALRAEVAEPGLLAHPLHFDWAARDTLAPPAGAALPLPRAAWEAARIEGAGFQLAAAGAEPPRPMLDLPAGAAPGEFAVRSGEAAKLQVALRAGPDPELAQARDSGWRVADGGGGLRIALPLPAGLDGVLHLAIAVRNRGAAPALLEVS